MDPNGLRDSDCPTALYVEPFDKKLEVKSHKLTLSRFGQPGSFQPLRFGPPKRIVLTASSAVVIGNPLKRNPVKTDV